MAGNALSGDARRLLLADPDAIALGLAVDGRGRGGFGGTGGSGAPGAALSCTLPGTQCPDLTPNG